MTDVAKAMGTPASKSVDDYDAMLARAEALVPALSDRASQSEELRRLPPETERDLHSTGLFRIFQPRRLGGREFDYVAMIDFPAILARGDASVAWNLANLASHHWMLAMFDPAAQDAVWNDNYDVLIASSFIFPCGRATKVDGGYVLSGRWPFSSGVEPSEWNMLAGTVSAGDGHPPEQRIFIAHRRDYTIIDTWDSVGLRGTGSHDVAMQDVFVPMHMTLAVRDVAGGPTPGSTRNPGTLYRLPVFALFPYVLSGIALGNAQGCLDDFEASMRTRASRYNAGKLSDLQSMQIKLGAAAARIDAAKRIMRGVCIEAMADAAAGRIPDLRTKTAYRRDGAYSVGLCTEAVDTLFAVSGAGALYRSGALQRRFRDAHAVAAHIAFSFDAAGGNYGRVALGLPSDNPTL